jgi:nitrogen-specific signal transduction histidine kinase
MCLKKRETEKPKLTIRLLKNQDMACIEVEDNGPGMDENTRKNFFEPFLSFIVKTLSGMQIKHYLNNPLQGCFN